MNDSNQPPPLRRSSFFLEDLVVAAVRGMDYISSGWRQPWRWRRPNDGPVPARKTPKSRPRPKLIASGSAAPGGSRKRVLLVESEPLTRLMLTDKLQAAGLEVEAAPDLGVAFQNFRASFPDAIFMELVSGGIHATELIREARRDPVFSSRPIYVYTCQGLNVAPGQGVAGANKVFNKLSSPAGAVVAAFLDELGVEGGAAPLPLSETDAATLEQIPALMGQQISLIGSDLQTLAQKSTDVEACTAAWKELRSRVRGLVSCAAVAGRRDLARQTAGIEAFLKELNAEPNHVAAGSWQTLCSAAEVLEFLIGDHQVMEQPQPSELTAVIVDETLESRMETTHALLNAGFAAVSFSKSPPALKHLESHHTDLLVIDLTLSDLDRFCQEAAPSLQDRCVIFVQRADLQNDSPHIGGAQLCARNLTGPHLGLKALTLVQRHRCRFLLDQPAQPGPEIAEISDSAAIAPDLKSSALPQADIPDETTDADLPSAAEEPTPASLSLIQNGSEPAASEVLENSDADTGEVSNAALEPAPVDPSKIEIATAENDNTLEDSDPVNPEPGIAPDPSPDTVMQTNYKPKAGKVQPIPSDIPDVFFKNDAAPAAEASAAASPGPVTQPKKAIAGLAGIPDLFFKNAPEPQPEQREAKAAEPPVEAAAQAAALQSEVPALPWGEPPAKIEMRPPKSDTEFARREAEKARESMLQRAYTDGMQQQRLEAFHEAEARKQLENQVQSLVAANSLLERRLMEQNRSHDEMARYSAELQEKLQAAEESSHREAAKLQRLEEEMAEFRRERDQIRGRLQNEHQTFVDAQRRFQDLEHSLRERTAELEQARLELQRAGVERIRWEAERDEIKTGTSDTVTLPGSGVLKKTELERQLREKVTELAHVTAELENEKGERRRCEQRAAALAGQLQSLHDELSQHLEAERSTHQRITALEQRVLEREQTIAQVRSDLQKEAADRRLAEEELKTATDLGRQMQNNLALYEETRKMFKSTQEQLEAKLKASLAALNDNEARLQRESSERRRLMEALEESQRALKDQTQTSSLELSKAQSGMQLTHFEKKCLEAELLRTRQDSVTSARANRAVVHNLRQQLKQPVDNLYLFACQLLRKELPDEQKKVAQVLLENALLLQTTLRDAEPIASEPNAEGQGTQPASE